MDVDPSISTPSCSVSAAASDSEDWDPCGLTEWRKHGTNSEVESQSHPRMVPGTALHTFYTNSQLLDPGEPGFRLRSASFAVPRPARA
jgi:hypothetical protein